ncbi:MAG: single-stranded-DNA-specific exonuclease RecJ [Clostridia bacterium]|nr:single-stranded-DNA-specific exonuclease RecJ [Clostridia bacterium]
MSRKRWQILDSNPQAAAEISEQFGISPVTSLLLASRGFCADEAVEDFLMRMPDFQCPYDLIDMDKAVDRINLALENGEKIAVYGDYDADGVTATTLLFRYFKSRGADVIWYVPERCEGYGLNNNAIDFLCGEGVRLIVTVDNGVAAFDEAEYIYSKGMELVVTDHHQPMGRLPRACAVVNPHREDCPSVFKDYAGVGVAFKLVTALEECDDETLLEQYGEYVAIGTVADIVPLVGENRLFVKYGIDRINSTDKPAIKELKSVCVVDGEVNSTNISFMFAPRINAAGRVGFARDAVNLLLSDDPHSAGELARMLNSSNQERQSIEAEVFAQASRLVELSKMNIYNRVIVVSGKDWHEGVLGIVSARLTELYGKPTIVLSESGDTAKGSCRSVEGFSIFEALHSVGDMLKAYGGHSMAAGVTVAFDRIDEFRRRINEYARLNFEYMPYPVIRIDCRVNPRVLTPDFVEGFKELEPFGAGNPQPVFGLFRMQLDRVVPLAKGKYVKLVLSKKGASVDVVSFAYSPDSFPFAVGDVVDVAVRLSENNFRGRVELSARLADIRMSGEYENEVLDNIRIYEKGIRGEELTLEELEAITPGRETLNDVYRYIRRNGGFSDEAEMLYHRLMGRHSLSSILTAVDILSELRVISLARRREKLIVELIPDCERCNIENSRILMNLRHRLACARGE